MKGSHCIFPRAVSQWQKVICGATGLTVAAGSIYVIGCAVNKTSDYLESCNPPEFLTKIRIPKVEFKTNPALVELVESVVVLPVAIVAVGLGGWVIVGTGRAFRMFGLELREVLRGEACCDIVRYTTLACFVIPAVLWMLSPSALLVIGGASVARDEIKLWYQGRPREAWEAYQRTKKD